MGALTSGGCAFRHMSPPVLGPHNLVSMFSFKVPCSVRGNVVPGNVNVTHIRTRCPDAVLLVASQGAPVVY